MPISDWQWSENGAVWSYTGEYIGYQYPPSAPPASALPSGFSYVTWLVTSVPNNLNEYISNGYESSRSSDGDTYQYEGYDAPFDPAYFTMLLYTDTGNNSAGPPPQEPQAYIPSTYMASGKAPKPPVSTPPSSTNGSVNGGNDFSDRIIIPPGSVVSGTTAGATKETAWYEPYGAGGGKRWYQITGPAGGGPSGLSGLLLTFEIPVGADPWDYIYNGFLGVYKEYPGGYYPLPPDPNAYIEEVSTEYSGQFDDATATVRLSLLMNEYDTYFVMVDNYYDATFTLQYGPLEWTEYRPNEPVYDRQLTSHMWRIWEVEEKTQALGGAYRLSGLSSRGDLQNRAWEADNGISAFDPAAITHLQSFSGYLGAHLSAHPYSSDHSRTGDYDYHDKWGGGSEYAEPDGNGGYNRYYYKFRSGSHEMYLVYEHADVIDAEGHNPTVAHDPKVAEAIAFRTQPDTQGTYLGGQFTHQLAIVALASTSNKHLDVRTSEVYEVYQDPAALPPESQRQIQLVRIQDSDLSKIPELTTWFNSYYNQGIGWDNRIAPGQAYIDNGSARNTEKILKDATVLRTYDAPTASDPNYGYTGSTYTGVDWFPFNDQSNNKPYGLIGWGRLSNPQTFEINSIHPIHRAVCFAAPHKWLVDGVTHPVCAPGEQWYQRSEAQWNYKFDFIPRPYSMLVFAKVTTTPPMRQRRRDDGLATDARQQKGNGSSLQSSIRRGGRTYY